MRKFTGNVLLVTALSLSWPVQAHAYVDPGSGSMLLQLVLGGVAGLVVVLRLYWQRVLRLLGSTRRRRGEAGLKGGRSPAAGAVAERDAARTRLEG